MRHHLAFLRPGLFIYKTGAVTSIRRKNIHIVGVEKKCKVHSWLRHCTEARVVLRMEVKQKYHEASVGYI